MFDTKEHMINFKLKQYIMAFIFKDVVESKNKINWRGANNSEQDCL